VKPGAIANVGEDMLFVDERGLADPGCAFSPHLCEGDSVAIHPDRHVVATNAGERTAALRHARAGVVRAAAAKPWWPLSRCLDRRAASDCFFA
jgi:hypothetical protein